MKMKLIRWLRRLHLWPQMKREPNWMRRWVIELMHDERGVLPDLVAVTLNDLNKNHIHAALLRPPLTTEKRAMVRKAFAREGNGKPVLSMTGQHSLVPLAQPEWPRDVFEIRRGFGSEKVL